MTREELLNIIETDHVQCGEAAALARMALVALDCEPVAEVYQAPNVGICAALSPSIRMLCPLEPGTKLYRHAQPALVIPESCSAQFGNFQHYWHSKGYVMVPKEPTEVMCDISHIGVDVYCGITDDNEYYSIGGADAAKVWKAMLAAAPQSPGSESVTVPEVKP